MIDYRAGNWGFHVSLGWRGSLAPRALTMAIPNAFCTLIVASLIQQYPEQFNVDGTSTASMDSDYSETSIKIIAGFNAVMIFVLYNRSRISYQRWWEGGTLLQKTRGEWFNAYSSIMAFTSTKPELQDQVESYVNLLARLMSLLMCCGLQQVSPNRDRPFEIIDLAGIEPESMEFLNSAPDKVEVILQWIQRSMVLHIHTGVLPVAPPILSRAFQEVSRGIVNLQNARKIADFPYPFPLAQFCMILQLLHYMMTPVISCLALPRPWAVLLSFFSIFVLWCIHFNALDLEFPFGNRCNDLPMNEMQQDWNKSVITLLDKRATRPPMFQYDPLIHDQIDVVMSDLSELYVPKMAPPLDKGVAVIKVSDKKIQGRPRLEKKTSSLCPSQDSALLERASATFATFSMERLGTVLISPRHSDLPLSPPSSNPFESPRRSSDPFGDFNGGDINLGTPAREEPLEIPADHGTIAVSHAAPETILDPASSSQGAHCPCYAQLNLRKCISQEAPRNRISGGSADSLSMQMSVEMPRVRSDL